GLLAVGECSCTGLHGANRLASNSLSECFVFGRRAAAAATAESRVTPAGPPPEPLTDAPPGEETRRALWSHAGLVRDGDGLRKLANDPSAIARMIGHSALSRRESRGCQLR